MHMHAVFSSGVRLGTDRSTVVHLFFHPLTTYVETHLSLALFFPLSLSFPILSFLSRISDPRRPAFGGLVAGSPTALPGAARSNLTRLVEAARPRRGGKTRAPLRHA